MSERLDMVVRTIAETAIQNEQYFTELDGVVGDGDFGYSLARGFEKVLGEWDGIDHQLPGPFLNKVASIIISAVGGVSGTIWGTAFMRAGMALGTTTEIERADTIAALRASIEGIKKRGQSDVGDKTLLDSFVPAVDALERSFVAGESGSRAMAHAAAAARTSADATREMLAKRGRAAYTGERSIGSLDAGAVAVAVMVEAVARDWIE